jgi:hypothetical protein
MHRIYFLIYLILLGKLIFAQYSEDFVSTSAVNIGNEQYSVVKMSRQDKRVKVKYFAAKDYNGTPVYTRYQEWARSKNVIALSSGTYMTSCDASSAKPVGLCIDNGSVVNQSIETTKLDGLAIVYPAGGGGGMVVSNMKDCDLTVNVNGTNTTLCLKNSWDFSTFLSWAKDNQATVFQTHLFVYKNSLKVGGNGSPAVRERRFLAVGKDDEGNIMHYIVNLSGANTVYDASVKVKKYLNDRERLDITFMINLDTGCQNVFQVYQPNGRIDSRTGFSGTESLTQATNLVVYYYE